MIARKSFLIVASRILVQFIGWIGLVVLAKLWGNFAPDALGIIGFAMAFIAMFDIISDLGFYQAHIKRISEGKDLGTCIGTFAAIKILLTTLMVSVVLLAIFIWKNLFKNDFYDATTESVVYVIILYYVFANLCQIATTTFEARKEIAKREVTYLFECIKTPLMIMVAFAGVTAVNISSPIIWPQLLQPIREFVASHAVGSLAMTYVFAVLASLIVGLWLLRSYPIKKPSWKLGGEYVSFALPIMLISIIGVISINIDKIMIGYFWTSTEVGYYFSVQQIIQMIMIFHIAVGTVLFPTFSEFHAKRDFKKIKEAVYTSERYTSMVMVPPVIFIIIFTYPIVGTLLSSAFYPAASTLIVLALYVFILSLIRPLSALISGINKPTIGAKIGVVMCSINIVLNYLFIPKNGFLYYFGVCGPVGAAFATLFSGLFGFILFRYTIRKLVGVKIIYTHILRHIIAGLVMALALYPLSISMPTIQWYYLIVFAFMGLGIYLGVLYIIKEFNKKDFNFFLDLLRPKEMVRYMASELRGEDNREEK